MGTNSKSLRHSIAAPTPFEVTETKRTEKVYLCPEVAPVRRSAILILTPKAKGSGG